MIAVFNQKPNQSVSNDLASASCMKTMRCVLTKAKYSELKSALSALPQLCSAEQKLFKLPCNKWCVPCVMIPGSHACSGLSLCPFGCVDIKARLAFWC